MYTAIIEGYKAAVDQIRDGNIVGGVDDLLGTLFHGIGYLEQKSAATRGNVEEA